MLIISRCAPKLGPILYDPLNYEIDNNNHPANENGQLLTPLAGRISSQDNGPVADTITVGKNGPVATKLLGRRNDDRTSEKDMTGEPQRRPCDGYIFDENKCKIINNRILCGYDLNKGEINNKEEITNLGNGCRIRGDRLECGYLTTDKNQTHTPPHTTTHTPQTTNKPKALRRGELPEKPLPVKHNIKFKATAINTTNSTDAEITDDSDELEAENIQATGLQQTLEVSETINPDIDTTFATTSTHSTPSQINNESNSEIDKTSTVLFTITKPTVTLENQPNPLITNTSDIKIESTIKVIEITKPNIMQTSNIKEITEINIPAFESSGTTNLEPTEPERTKTIEQNPIRRDPTESEQATIQAEDITKVATSAKRINDTNSASLQPMKLGKTADETTVKVQTTQKPPVTACVEKQDRIVCYIVPYFKRKLLRKSKAVKYNE